jgi:uncharacterized protein (DUF1501 family)
MTFNRRDILKAGLTGLPFFSMPREVLALEKVLAGHPAIGAKRMLTIYLRGGADSLNMVVPFLDPNYAPLRPVVKLDPPGSASNACLTMPGYPALGLHPALAQLRTINPRNVAYLCRTGHLAGERSHFTEQHLTETGRSTYSATDSGWLPQAMGIAAPTSALGAVSISKRLQRLYLAADGLAGPGSLHLQNPYTVASGAAPRILDIPYAVPGQPTASIDALVASSVQAAATYPRSADAIYLRDTIADASSSLATLRSQLGSFTHDPKYPVAGDPAPSGSNLSAAEIATHSQFFAHLEEAVQLLRIQSALSNPLANVVGIELGGWDTHANQRNEQDPLLRVLAQGLKAAFTDLSADTADFLILVVTEFGRTIKDNSSGTDHGVGGMTVVLGNKVKGGVYNAHDPSWPAPTHPSLVLGQPWTPLITDFNGFGDAQRPVTDFRVPYIEIVEKFFGINVATLPGVGGQWQQIRLNQGAPFDRLLGFL